MAQDVGATRETDLARLRIEGLAAGGRGVAHALGQVWFVAGGLPGDLVEASAARRRPRWVEGRSVRLIEPSPARRPPICPVQSACGGCSWMPLALEEQRAWKRRFVSDALSRIGRIEDVEVDPVASAGSEFGYRNKVELALGRDRSGAPRIGFRAAERPSEIVDVSSCIVQHPEADAVLCAVRKLLLEPGAPWSGWFDRSREGRLVIRRSWHTGRCLVAVRREGSALSGAAEFGRRLMAACPVVSGVVELVAHRGRRGGTIAIPVAGTHRFVERIGDVVFELPPASFLQVHTAMASALMQHVAATLEPLAGRRVLDLYAGVGTLGLNLAVRGAAVTLVEADRAAVAATHRTARRHRLPPAPVHAADVAEWLATAAPGAFDAIVANPPRSGLAPEVVGRLGDLRAERIVLVSCDPATLARDAGRLVRAGYRATRAAPFDLFPQTPHVETVLVLER